VQVGDPIREGWSIYQRFWRHLLPIALVTYVVVSVIALVLALAGGVVGSLASVVVSVAGVFLLQAALVEAVADVRDGRVDLTLTETLARVWPRVGAVAGASILAAIGIAVGFVLLIVPGLYLVTIWSVVIPALVLEQLGVTQAFGRSRTLVSGHGWTVFGVIVVTFVINFLASIALGIVLGGLPTELSRYVANVVVNTLIAPFVAATWTCMYFRLRSAHEPQGAVPSAAV
jgi:hypothetical protein